MPKITVHGGPSDEHDEVTPTGGDVVEPTPDTGAEQVDSREFYEALTVADLRAELEARGKETKGHKPELVDRLVAADAEGAAKDAE
ncbi:MAG: hypothetical protein JWQ81_8512 [Amycolatopsis sp.]|uniref:SAP domain-containing protein n=1 Tax=Amycolatopsis sp. TaxID=37632 RepID=UPI002615C902|nr:SAP domain-containing protein [Amycolatopsis sp.]MCU1687773.1 hypothetical protein [Amycolatopsis sp.]